MREATVFFVVVIFVSQESKTMTGTQYTNYSICQIYEMNKTIKSNAQSSLHYTIPPSNKQEILGQMNLYTDSKSKGLHPFWYYLCAHKMFRFYLSNKQLVTSKWLGKNYSISNIF